MGKQIHKAGHQLNGRTLSPYFVVKIKLQLVLKNKFEPMNSKVSKWTNTEKYYVHLGETKNKGVVHRMKKKWRVEQKS